jgi:hypothetical protein
MRRRSRPPQAQLWERLPPRQTQHPMETRVFEQDLNPPRAGMSSGRGMEDR